jgi:hypothetical protein
MTTKEHASVKPIRLAMIRDDMEHVPFHPVPDYALRTYRLGDERRWAAIEVSAGSFRTKTEPTAVRHGVRALPRRHGKPLLHPRGQSG